MTYWDIVKCTFGWHRWRQFHTYYVCAMCGKVKRGAKE